jgi:hypothetical protein
VDAGIDLGDSSDDSDFIMESSSGTSIPEDYDSQVEETDADDGNGSDTDGSDQDTDPNSADGNARNENGLDAFAVISGSDSDS